MKLALAAVATLATALSPGSADESPIRIGLNAPKSGPYAVQGLDQLRGATLAVEEVNAAGGVLGRPLDLVVRDSQSMAGQSTENVIELIERERCRMIFGGATNTVAVAASRACNERATPFFGTLTYSSATTGSEGRRFTFRECFDSWAGVKVVAETLNRDFAGKTYFYITAERGWEQSVEDAFRRATDTRDTDVHKRLVTAFPESNEEHFKRAISFAKLVDPDVLVLSLYGRDMELALRQATSQGLKSKMQIVVPSLTLGLAEAAGPKVMEGVLGSLAWSWNVPATYGYERGQAFVTRFAERYERYPSSSGASAYSIVHAWSQAVERAGTVAGNQVVTALEGASYTLLKDEQTWRAWDHQSIQSVFAVRCRPEAEVRADPFQQDYFRIVGRMEGADCFRTREGWNALRIAAGKPAYLEAFGEGVAQRLERTARER